MKIFVTRLNSKTSEIFLTRLFESVGTVDSCKLIMDRETGKSRGFAFIEMPNELEAKNAIAKFDGSDIDGRKIVVKVAEDRGHNAQNTNRSNKPDNRGGYKKKFGNDRNY